MLDDRHALYVGWVAGLAHRQGLDFSAVMDAEGWFTNHLVLELDGIKVTVVVPPPPADWTLEPT